nr:Uncharacterised protein [Providencia rettgeri]
MKVNIIFLVIYFIGFLRTQSMSQLMLMVKY